MLLPRLVDTGGGPGARLGAIVKKFFRKVIRGDRSEPGFKPEAEFPVVKFQGNDAACTPLAPAFNGNAFSVVRRGAHEILARYLARNRIGNLAAEMRNRYAFRLMSGPAGFSPSGLGRNRLAIYGFVGISFGTAIGSNRVGSEQLSGENGDCWEVRVVKELFGKRREAWVVANNVSNKIEEDRLSDFGEGSVSDESDIVVLSNDDESDFEVLESTESFTIANYNDQTEMEPGSSDEVQELRELVALEVQQNAQLILLVQKLCQENKALRKMIDLQEDREQTLKNELTDILMNNEVQHRDILELRKSIQDQNSALKVLSNWHKAKETTETPRQGKGREFVRGLRDTVVAEESGRFGRTDSLENERERLRAAGGRMRALKVHRKQRLKRN